METTFFPFAQNSADVGVIGGAIRPTAIFTTSTTTTSILSLVVTVVVIAVVGFILWKKFGHK